MDKLVAFHTFINVESVVAEHAAILKPTQILPRGVARTVDGRKLRVEDDDFGIILADLATRKNKVAILYEHGRGPNGGKAVGWIDAFRVEEKGMFGLVGWTANAREEIRKDEWRYISPGFFGTIDDDENIRPRVLFEASLTNIANIDGMEEVAASVQTPPAPTREDIANPSTPKEGEMDLKKIAEALGAEPTEESILGAIAVKGEAEKVAQDRVTKLDKLLTTAEVAIGERAKEEAAKLVANAEHARKVAEVVETAVKSGIVTPALRESATKLASADPDAFKQLVESKAAAAPQALPRADAPDPLEAPNPVSRKEAMDAVIKYATMNRIPSLLDAREEMVAKGLIAREVN